MQRNKRLKWETCFETKLQWRLASQWTNGESKFNYWNRWWVTWLRIDAKAWSLSVDFVWNSGPKSKASIDAWYTDNSRSVDLSKGIYALYIQATNIGFVVRACKNFVHMVSLSFKYPFKFSTSNLLKLLVNQHWKKNFSVRHNAQIRTSNSPEDFVVTRWSVTECAKSLVETVSTRMSIRDFHTDYQTPSANKEIGFWSVYCESSKKPLS